MQARQTLHVRRDTRAWQVQVWISFGLAALLCGIGLAWLPGRDLDRAFMVMGYVFCLSMAFALAKFVRDNQVERSDTPMWSMVVWSGFALAMGLTAWGLWRMEINPTYKAYLGVCWLYLISSAFTLAKMLRDAFEADLDEAREEGRAEACASTDAGAHGSKLRLGLCSLLAVWLAFVPLDDARAHDTHHYHPTPSDASAVSLLPVAISVAAPVLLVSGGAALTVVAVEASAHGSVWVLERASDGARASVELAGHASVGAGTLLVTTAVSTGWLLSAAGEVIAFIPNEIGAALLYNERIGR